MYGQLTVLRDFTQEHELEQLRDDYTNMLIHDPVSYTHLIFCHKCSRGMSQWGLTTHAHHVTLRFAAGASGVYGHACYLKAAQRGLLGPQAPKKYVCSRFVASEAGNKA